MSRSLVQSRPRAHLIRPCSSVAERILGKDEVGGSIPPWGSISPSHPTPERKENSTMDDDDDDDDDDLRERWCSW